MLCTCLSRPIVPEEDDAGNVRSCGYCCRYFCCASACDKRLPIIPDEYVRHIQRIESIDDTMIISSICVEKDCEFISRFWDVQYVPYYRVYIQYIVPNSRISSTPSAFLIYIPSPPIILIKMIPICCCCGIVFEFVVG